MVLPALEVSSLELPIGENIAVADEAQLGKTLALLRAFQRLEPIRRVNRGVDTEGQLNGSNRKENCNQTQTSNKNREESFYSEVKTKSFVVSRSCKNCSLFLEQGWNRGSKDTHSLGLHLSVYLS